MSQPSESEIAAIKAAGMLQHLDPGSLAELRRMEPGRAAPSFWRLVARHPDTIGNPHKEASWMEIVRILAILTPKGDPDKRDALHNTDRRLGQVLCDGGDPNWPGKDKPRPAISEYRLMRLIASRDPQRTVLLTRAMRAIARSMSPGSGLNVPDLAWVLLSPDENTHLAKHYYKRLDRADRVFAKQSESE